jgi:hypothetical protein
VRRIDRVRLRGSAVPVSLYTYDCGEAGGYFESAAQAPPLAPPAPAAPGNAHAPAHAPPSASPLGGPARSTSAPAALSAAASLASCASSPAPPPSAPPRAATTEQPGVGPDGGGCTGMPFADYRVLFASGVDAYIAGDWPVACEALRRCSAAWPSDVPARVLLGVMDAAGGEAPRDWCGVRELTEK